MTSSIRRRQHLQIMKRILFYTPYSYWYLHTLYEITIAHALKMRAHDVRMVVCDGEFTDCDVAWKAVRPRTDDTCKQCMAKANQVFDGMKMPFEKLGTYLQGVNRQEVSELVEGLPADSLKDFEYQGEPLGSWVISSVHSHFRANKLDFGEEQVSAAFRSYLYSGIMAFKAISKMLEDYKPDSAFLFNGRMFSQRIFLELARKRGIHVLVHERGVLANSLGIFENMNCLDIRHWNNYWAQWKGVPLAANELQKISSYLKARESGTAGTWNDKFVGVWQDKSQEADSDIRAELGITKEAQIVSLFNSSEDEGAELAAEQNIIDSKAWMEASIQFFACRPEYVLVIRLHPNVSGLTGANKQFLDWFKNRHAFELPDNVKVIWPEDKFNSYSLLQASCACLTNGSSISLEATIMGTAVMIAKKNQFYKKGFGLCLERAQDFEIELMELLKHKVNISELRSAYRFAYRAYVGLSPTFPLIAVDKVHDAHTAYHNTDALKEGMDQTVDRICDALIHKRVFNLAPDKDISAYSSFDEDAFLEKQIKALASRGERGLKTSNFTEESYL